jgi:hypothetical protein
MLVFACPSCAAKLQMPDELAGKKVRCGSCQAVVTAPMQGEKPDAITAGAPTSAPVPTAVTPGERRSRSATKDRDREDDETPLRKSGSGATAAAVTAGLGTGAIIAIVLGLFLCLGGCGVVAVLVGLLLPAVQKVREAAGRVETTNNMKEIGLACLNYHDAHGNFPPPKMMTGPKPAELSWRVSILPFMVSGGGLANQFDMTSGWDSPRNQPLVTQMPKSFEYKSRDDGKKGNTFFQYFTGPGTMWPDNNTRRRIADITDGTSNTFLFAEAANGVPWSKPADMAVQPGQPLPLPPATFLACFADGSVRLVDRRRASDATLLAYISPNGGEMPPPLD